MNKRKAVLSLEFWVFDVSEAVSACFLFYALLQLGGKVNTCLVGQA